MTESTPGLAHEDFAEDRAQAANVSEDVFEDFEDEDEDFEDYEDEDDEEFDDK